MLKTLEEVKKDHVIAVLTATNFNMAQAARVLAVNRRTLYRMCGKYGVILVRSWTQDGIQLQNGATENADPA